MMCELELITAPASRVIVRVKQSLQTECQAWRLSRGVDKCQLLLFYRSFPSWDKMFSCKIKEGHFSFKGQGNRENLLLTLKLNLPSHTVYVHQEKGGN